MVYTVIIIIGVLIYFKLKSLFGRWQAAHNVILAKYTYGLLDETEQEVVRERVRDIFLRTGWPYERIDQNEAAKYGCYALAMAELGIRPRAINDAWNLIKNPWRAITPDHRYLTSVAALLKKETGVEIVIDPVDHMFDDLRKGR
jgi:hypothetical protein